MLLRKLYLNFNGFYLNSGFTCALFWGRNWNKDNSKLCGARKAAKVRPKRPKSLSFNLLELLIISKTKPSYKTRKPEIGKYACGKPFSPE